MYHPQLSFSIGRGILLLTAGLLVSCRRAETGKVAPDAKVVAVVAGVEISAEALARELKVRGASGANPPTAERKLDVLESLVREEAVFAKAKAAHFDDTPEMQAQIRRLVVSRFLEREFAPRNVSPTKEEVAAFYEANAAKYATPAAARGAIIFIPCPATALPEKKAVARSRAESILAAARAADGAKFVELVAKESAHQPTRYRGGELPWLIRDSRDVDPAVRDAVLAIAQPGEFAPLVAEANGFYIVKLLERREAGRKALAEVEEGIRYELSRKKSEQAERDFYTAMKSGLDIQIHREAVEALTLPASKEAPPPAMPGATAQQVSK